MFDKLKDIINNSYSPYSNFRVAAIVTTNDGNEFYGVNVENASYGAGICAERSAIVSAVSHGYKKGDFKSLDILCMDSKKISTSCFICRQVISEFFNDDAIITCYSPTDKQEFTVKDLCPYPFTEDDLK